MTAPTTDPTPVDSPAATPDPAPAKALRLGDSALTAPLALHTREFKLGLEPEGIKEALTLCATIARTGICGIKSAEDALLRLMTGRALGLPAMVSLRKIKVFENQPWLDYDLVLALCLQHPMCEYFDMIESTKERATFVAKRKGRPPVTMTFTMDDARDAQLLDRGETQEKKDKNNWNRWKPDMLRSKCIIKLARIVVPEAAMGMDNDSAVDDGDGDANVITVDGKTGEVLSETKPVQVPSRDYDAETKDFVAKMDAVKTPADRKALRAAFEGSDIPEPWHSEIRAAYNARFARAPTNHAPASDTPAAAPAGAP
jgi:hypothetical protein